MKSITPLHLLHTTLLLIMPFSVSFSQSAGGNKLRTQLATAIADGDVPGVEQAVKAGVDTNDLGEGKSAWYLAVTAEKYQPEIVKLFKAQPGDKERAATTLHSAALSNNFPYIEHLAKAGVDLNTRSTEMSNQTPLMIAAFDGFTQTVRILLAHGADMTLKDAKGQTALDIAKAAVKTKRWLQSDLGIPETEYRTVLKLLDKDKARALVGKIFEVDEKRIQITGKDIVQLRKGNKIQVKTASGNISGIVNEVLHTKAKATLTKAGAKKGDPVFLSAD